MTFLLKSNKSWEVWQLSSAGHRKWMWDFSALGYFICSTIWARKFRPREISALGHYGRNVVQVWNEIIWSFYFICQKKAFNLLLFISQTSVYPDLFKQKAFHFFLNIWKQAPKTILLVPDYVPFLYLLKIYWGWRVHGWKCSCFLDK